MSSIEQIWGRLTRIAAAQGIGTLFEGRSRAEALQQAEALIREENERDRREKWKNVPPVAERKEASVKVEEKYRAEWERACRVLGLSSDASFRQITEAYRINIAQHHPDHNGMSGEVALRESTRRTQELNEAFGMLRKLSGQ